MAIQWSGFVNHLRIGVDIWTDGYDTYTPSINVYCAVYVGVDGSWNFNDSQTAVLSGSVGGSWTFQNTMGANGVVHVGTATIGGQGQSYGGGPTYTFAARLDGVYLGAGPSGTWYFSLPPRPIRPPTAPGAPSASGITGRGGTIGWGYPADVGGSGLDYNWLQVDNDSNFSSLVYDNQTPGWVGRDLTTLSPGTTYYMRAAAHNAAGWSGWSGTGSFTTNAFQAQSLAVSPTGSSANVTWAAPAVGPTPVGYELQYSTASTFTSPVTLTGGWATSRAITGLVPGTTYYYRVRADSGGGYGAYSTTTTSATNAFQVGAPTVVVQAVSANVSWTAPSSSDTPTRYDVQAAPNSGFTSGVITVSKTTWALSDTVTGLTPGTDYWFRVRAGTATGFGAYSPATQMKTLSGAKIRQNGVWVDAIAYARVNGAWVQVLVKKRVNGAWVQ